MYVVQQQGKTIAVFTRFVDAWLFVFLECECFASILDLDEYECWTVNPAYYPSRPIN